LKKRGFFSFYTTLGLWYIPRGSLLKKF